MNVDRSKQSAAVKPDGSIQNVLASGRNEHITVTSGLNVDSFSLDIPVSFLSFSGGGSLTLETDIGSVTIPSNMLTGIDGKEAQITISKADVSDLPADVRAAIGNRPVIQMALTTDGRQIDWNNPDAPVTVSIPYTPAPEELSHPESIIIWYIDGSGNLICVPDGRYNAETGTVTFTTTHFSCYAAGFNNMEFSDVPEDAPYYKAVGFIAARGITKGVGDGKYGPDAGLTRADFLVLLMRAYGIDPDENPTDIFADAGNFYYTGYLAAAKRLGISSGVGNNLFAPEQLITRQEMFTLMYKTLKIINRLPSTDSGKDLTDFSDYEEVAVWAREAITHFVAAGIINGSNGKLLPANTTTREEMAQVLYSLMSK